MWSSANEQGSGGGAKHPVTQNPSTHPPNMQSGYGQVSQPMQSESEEQSGSTTSSLPKELPLTTIEKVPRPSRYAKITSFILSIKTDYISEILSYLDSAKIRDYRPLKLTLKI